MDYTEMSPEQLHGSALAFLLEGDDEDAAAALAKCKIERVFDDSSMGSTYNWHLTVYARAPRSVYDQVNEDIEFLNRSRRGVVDPGSLRATKFEVGGRIWDAFVAVLPHGDELDMVQFRAHVADIGDKHMLADLIAQTFGGDINNQAPLARGARFWNDLRFRSATEIKIAEALDDAGVMFFPLCRARVTIGKQRVTREPDFLVCDHGKWGILEVDGAPFHPATRTTQDHERDRLFHAHGVRVVQHFDAEQSYQHPRLVVNKFLEILAKNG